MKVVAYASDRYQYEARRHYSTLDAQLAPRPFLLRDVYMIVDMAAWGWARAVPFVPGDTAWTTIPHLQRWFDAISARPAAIRANALKDRFTFKADMDEEARRIIFPHTVKA